MNIHTQAKIQLIKYLRNQIKKAVASFFRTAGSCIGRSLPHYVEYNGIVLTLNPVKMDKG